MLKQKKKTYGIHTIFLLCLLIGSNLLAQPQRHQPPMLPDSTRIVKMIDMLTETLSLSEKQIIEISHLHFTHFAEAKDLTLKHESDRESHRNEMDSLKKELNKQIEEHLNQEQISKYKKIKSQRRPENRQPRPEHKK